MSLCRLWDKKGGKENARLRLAAIYDWFDEGLDTPLLAEARDLLSALA